MLAAHGYEPRVQDDRVVLANCPFHALAREHTALVCGMNLHLITALLDELGRRDVQTRLDPAPQQGEAQSRLRRSRAVSRGPSRGRQLSHPTTLLVSEVAPK